MGLRSAIRKELNLFHSKYADTTYNIGIVEHSDRILEADTMPRIKWLKHNFKDRWFADPFIIAEDNKCFKILVESYFYKERVGKIGLIVADKQTFSLLRYKTVLDLPTHLSFPCWYSLQGRIFVYPENSRSGCNTLYVYDDNNETLDFVCVQCNRPLTDAVIVSDDRKTMLSTYSEDCNGNICRILSKMGDKYEETATITVSDNSARGAGLTFVTGDGRVIRPAQDCNGGYGVGLVFQEISFDTEGKPLLKEINRLKPNDPVYNVGLHTYNRFGDVAIVDGYYNPPEWGVRLFKMIQKLM